MGMGGPWIGELRLHDTVLANNVIVDSAVLNLDHTKIAYARYYETSKWMADNYFLIHILDIPSNKTIIYPTKFDAVYLEKFTSNDSLAIHEAFHGDHDRNRTTIRY